MTRIPFFALCVVVWTIALVVPVPTKPFTDAGIQVHDLKFYISKTAHVVGYAFLAALVAFLPLSRAKRLGLILFLSSHGFLTEFAQSFLSYRTGKLRDVGLDHIGILIGLLLTRRRWRRLPPETDGVEQSRLNPVEPTQHPPT